MRRHLLVCAMFALVNSGLLAEEESRVVVRPQDTGAALINPGMGWVFHHFDNSIHGYGPPLGDRYAGEDFPGLSVAYLRLAWSYLQPQEDRFDWSLIDSVAQRYVDAGRQVAFRFTCFETEIPYATPEWVQEAGAQGYWWAYGQGRVDGPTSHPHARWEPDYDDPVFLQKLDKFLQAAADRYDGSPHVAFVDIGSLGVWGEGHPCAKDYPLSTYRKHIDLHFKHFRKSLLVGMDDWQPAKPWDEPGSRLLAFHLEVPRELLGRELQIKAGLWIPGGRRRDLPQGRLLPADGQPDRRVLLGTVSVLENGTATFKPVPAVPVTAEDTYDFKLTPGRFWRRGDDWLLEVEYETSKSVPSDAAPFCHLSDGPDSILAGCWTQLISNEALDYSRSLGATMRDDSIIWREGFTFSSDWLAESFWRDRPVVIESGHYSANDWGDGSDYFRAIEAYHASYVSIHGDPYRIWNDHQDVIPQMNRRIGYRLQLAEASWPATVHTSVPFQLKWIWRNAGVAPCLPGGFPALTLKRDGAIVAVLVTEGLNVRDLPVGPPEEKEEVEHDTRCAVPTSMRPGPCDVFVSVGTRSGTPQLALPLAEDDGHRRYRLGTIVIKAADE